MEGGRESRKREGKVEGGRVEGRREEGWRRREGGREFDGVTLVNLCSSYKYTLNVSAYLIYQYA